ncbi:MAG: hypothetical protein HQL13_03870, partial [Candidatus Omnitrophica bacterium]|nr:hypothetical protein [Candidatus Omnitrophota bacterium]
MGETISHDANPVNRQEGLETFLSQYQESPDYIKSFEELVMKSPSDVVEVLFTHMVNQKNIPFFIDISVKAKIQGRADLVRWAGESIAHILINEPQQAGVLRKGNFTQSFVYSSVNLENTQNVLLSLLANLNENSVAHDRILLSDFWRPKDLARIYNSLGVRGSESLKRRISAAITRRMVLEMSAQLFQLGEFSNPQNLLTDADMANRGEIQRQGTQTRQALYSSWQAPKVAAVLFKTADGSATTIDEQVKKLLDNHSDQGASVSLLTYGPRPRVNQNFDNLSPDLQQRYIDGTQNVSLLASLLETQTPLKGVIVERLMKSYEGRIAALGAYVRTDDSNLCRLVETELLHWQGNIRQDISKIENSGESFMMRQALKKAYARTNQEWLYFRFLDATPDFDLPQVLEEASLERRTLIEQHILKRALKVAVSSFQEVLNMRTSSLAGHPRVSAHENDILQDVMQKCDDANHPLEITTYVNHLDQKDPTVRRLLEFLQNTRDMIAARIKGNVQNIPQKPSINGFQTSQAPMDMVRDIMASTDLVVAQHYFNEFMAEDNLNHLPVMIEVIAQAREARRDDLMYLAYQSLGDILLLHPGVKKVDSFNQTLFKSRLYPHVSQQSANQAFLSVMAQYPMVATRVLFSNYWAAEDLAGIYNQLDPQSELAKLIYDALVLKEAVSNTDRVITLGGYDKLISPFAILNAMLDNRSNIVRVQDWNRELSRGPIGIWHVLIKERMYPDLLARAESSALGLIADNRAGGKGLELDVLHHEMVIESYFKQTPDQESQRKYIENTSNLASVERILVSLPLYFPDAASQQVFSAAILHRLMDSPMGRALVLEAYGEVSESLKSETDKVKRQAYTDIMTAIEARDWTPLRQDILKSQDAAINQVYADGLLLMGRRTGNEFFWNLRLKTFHDLGLRPELVQDPRGSAVVDEEVYLRASLKAIEVIKNRALYRPQWLAARPTASAQEVDLDNLLTFINNTDNPGEVQKHIALLVQNTSDEKNRQVLSELQGIIEMIAHDIKTNNQSFLPWFIPSDPNLLVVPLLAVLAFSAFVKREMYKRRIRSAINHRDNQALLDELSPFTTSQTPINGNDQGKASFLSIRGVPVNAFSTTRDPLNKWRDLLRGASQGLMTPAETLENINKMSGYSKQVLTSLPYPPTSNDSKKFKVSLDTLIYLA